MTKTEEAKSWNDLQPGDMFCIHDDILMLKRGEELALTEGYTSRTTVMSQFEVVVPRGTVVRVNGKYQLENALTGEGLIGINALTKGFDKVSPKIFAPFKTTFERPSQLIEGMKKFDGITIDDVLGLNICAERQTRFHDGVCYRLNLKLKGPKDFVEFGTHKYTQEDTCDAHGFDEDNLGYVFDPDQIWDDDRPAIAREIRLAFSPEFIAWMQERGMKVFFSDEEVEDFFEPDDDLTYEFGENDDS
jgi:hypothetical protein